MKDTYRQGQSSYQPAWESGCVLMFSEEVGAGGKSGLIALSALTWVLIWASVSPSVRWKDCFASGVGLLGLVDGSFQASSCLPTPIFLKISASSSSSSKL